MSRTSGGGLFQQRTNATSHVQSPSVALGTHDLVVSTAYVTPQKVQLNVTTACSLVQKWLKI